MVRIPEHPVHDIILNRWSARAMSGEPVPEEQLMSLFEAAKWAPSSSNDQPWHFYYAKKGTPAWQMYYDLLSDGNKRWCNRAGVLILITSRKNFEKYGTFNQTHSFSAGSAFQNLALQGTSMGLVVHPMGGFDAEKAREKLAIPEAYEVEIMVAVGQPGDVSLLDEKDQVREKPSERKKIEEIITEA